MNQIAHHPAWGKCLIFWSWVNGTVLVDHYECDEESKIMSVECTFNGNYYRSNTKHLHKRQFMRTNAVVTIQVGVWLIFRFQ